MNAIPSYGASIAQSAIERKQKMKADVYSNQVETPKGNDGKKYRNFLLTDILGVLEINLMKIMIF
jgi:hypothetical protein